MRALWARFQPTGEVAATLTLIHDGVHWNPELDVQVRHLDFTFDKFPYRVNGAHGTMRLAQDQLTIDLETTISGQRVDIDGELDMVHDQGEPQGWGTVKTSGPIPLDEKMLSAIPERAQEAIRSLNLTGMIHCDARFDRNEKTGLEWSPSIHVSLSRGTMQYDAYPYPMSRVQARVHFVDDGWELLGLEAYNDTAYITMNGGLRSTPQGRALSFAIDGVDVPLDNSLRLTLPAEARKTWDAANPRGMLDKLAIRFTNRFDGQLPEFHITATKRDSQETRGGISLMPQWLPYRWDGVHGRLEVRNGSFSFHDLRGHHATSTLALDGQGGFDQDGWHVNLSRLSLENARASNELISAMRPERLRQALLNARIQGGIGVEGKIAFRGWRDRPQIASNWDLYFDLENGSLQMGAPVKSIRGGVRLRGGYDGQRLTSGGVVAIDSMVVRDAHLTRVHGPIWLDDTRLLFGADAYANRPELLQQSVLARAYQGVVRLDGQVALGGAHAFHTKIHLEHANLAQIVRQFGPSTENLAGKVRSTVDLWGNSRGTHTWTGKGEVHLTQADLYELPVMVGLLKLISVQRPDNNAFTNGDATFRIQGEHLYFDRIDFGGDVFTLRGTGEVDLQRNVNLQFYAALGRDRLFIPVIRPLLGETSRSFLLIEVDGPIGNLNWRRKAFPEISDRLQRLLPPEVAPRTRGPLTPSVGSLIPRVFRR